jgi:hypothetical protein
MTRITTKDVVPTPVEFRRKVETKDEFVFKDLLEGLKIKTSDGKSTTLHGLEQVYITYYSLENENSILEQFVKIPESEEPIVQQIEGKILNFNYPFIYRNDGSQDCGFRIIQGKGIIQFMGVAIVSPISNIVL